MGSLRYALRGLGSSPDFSERPPSSWSPRRDIDWNARSQLTNDHKELAWRLASQGAYTEEAGLLIAARLTSLIDDRSVRRLLAVQAAEEAKHAEAFERYANQVGGCVAEMPPTADSLLSSLDDVHEPLRLFIIHTFLEGLALDEFSILANVFQSDCLGSIYDHVKRDEANHVSMGLHYIETQCGLMQHDERSSYYQWCRDVTFFVSGLDDKAYRALAQLSDVDASDVGAMFANRFHRRCKRAFKLV